MRNPPDIPKQKEVGFGKLMGAAAAGNVAVDVVGTLLDIGNAARMTKLEKELRQVHQKLDLLLKQKTPDLTSLASLPDTFDPFESLSLLKLPTPIKLKK